MCLLVGKKWWGIALRIVIPALFAFGYPFFWGAYIEKTYKYNLTEFVFWSLMALYVITALYIIAVAVLNIVDRKKDRKWSKDLKF